MKFVQNCFPCFSCLNCNTDVCKDCSNNSLYARDMSKREDGSSYDLFALKIRNKKDNYTFDTIQYGDTVEQLTQFWKQNDIVSESYELLECKLVDKKGV